MRVFTLRNLWEQSGLQPGFRVRYINWDHKTQYFLVKSYDESRDVLIGELDTGENAEYPMDSQHWQPYDETREYAVHTI